MRNSISHIMKWCLILSGTLCLFVGGAYSSDTADNAQSISIDEIRYPDDRWGKIFLNEIKAGPRLLRGVTFDVAKPPVNSSDETKQELSFLQELAKSNRDDDTLSRIYYENSEATIHGAFIKEGLLSEDNELLFELMNTVYKEHGYFILERKKHFSRARPTQLDKTLVTVIDNPMHAAYPSGHASQSYMMALILSDFDPEHAEVYKRFAIDIAHRREIAGVHYPSDSAAGRELAIDVFEKLKSVAEFATRYEAVKESFVTVDFSKAANTTVDE